MRDWQSHRGITNTHEEKAQEVEVKSFHSIVAIVSVSHSCMHLISLWSTAPLLLQQVALRK